MHSYLSVFTYIDFFLILLPHMVEPFFFVEKFFAATATSENMVVMCGPCMIDQLFAAAKFLMAILALVLFSMEETHAISPYFMTTAGY